jgi:hypothetical protein
MSKSKVRSLLGVTIVLGRCILCSDYLACGTTFEER